MDHPHLRERGTVRRVKDASIGEFDIPGMPTKFSRWPYLENVVSDRLGEHNEEVLRDLLSMTDEEIARLYADKIVVRDPLLDDAANVHPDQKDAR